MNKHNYHIMNKHNYLEVPSKDAVMVCGRNMLGLNYVAVRYMKESGYITWCPGCLAHPKLPLYILEATEL